MFDKLIELYDGRRGRSLVTGERYGVLCIDFSYWADANAFLEELSLLMGVSEDIPPKARNFIEVLQEYPLPVLESQALPLLDEKDEEVLYYRVRWQMPSAHDAKDLWLYLDWL